MRHRVIRNRLARYSSWRKATIRDLAKATLVQERICTTFAKAKAACRLIDRLITLGKKNTLAARRHAFAILCDHQLVSELFKTTSPRFKERSGGYTRIIPLSTRRGDNAQLAYLELTEKSEVIISKPKTTAASKPQEAKDLEIAVDKDKPKTVEPEPQAPQKTKSIFNQFKIKDDKASQVKWKLGKNIMGSLKKMFRKKPSE